MIFLRIIINHGRNGWIRSVVSDGDSGIISPCVYGKELPDHWEIEVQNLLKRLNKPAVKSIKVFYTIPYACIYNSMLWEFVDKIFERLIN